MHNMEKGRVSFPIFDLRKEVSVLKDLLDMISYKPDAENNCLCLENLPLAYAYVPYQKAVKNTYTAAEALSRGTAFSELDKPYSVYGKEFKKGEGECKLL